MSNEVSNKKFTVSEVLDSFGVNKFTWIMFAFLGFAMLFDGYDFMIVNTTNLYLARTFWPDVASAGALMGSLTTWSLLGMVLGGAFGGILSDKLGRKKTLVMAIAFYSIFTFPQAFANSLPFFAAFRFIAGFGIGSCIPIVTTVFAETMPSKNRGVFITFGMAFMVLGWVVAGLVGNPIVNATEPLIPGFTEQVTYTTVDAGVEVQAEMYANWRLCYLIGAIPLLYSILLGFAMKETPHWYANAGHPEKAVQRLAQIEKQVTGKWNVRDPKFLMIPPKPAKTSPTVLFSKKYILATCAIWSTYFIGQFCVYGMNAWLPAWFVGIDYSPTDAITLQTLNNVAAIVSNVTVGFVSDRVGRKRNLSFAWLFAIAAIILCSLFIVPNNFALCVGLMLLFGFALNYAITAVQPIMPESYPTQIRSTGTSWAQAFARFGGAASAVVLGGLASMALFQEGSTTNWSMLVLVLIIPLAIGFICTRLFIQRDGKGKSMDAIQEEVETL